MITPEQKQAALFGRYFGGFDAPLVGLPTSPKNIESMRSFSLRRKIVTEIKMLDELFGPVGPRQGARSCNTGTLSHG